MYSDAQLDDGTLDLEAYRVLMISAHPEYWTKRAFERTLASVEERGGHFMYLGGNGINAEVELLDGATRMHVKSHLAAVNGSLGQPDPADPGHWFDSRFHRATGLPEARLLGVATTETGIMTAAPYRRSRRTTGSSRARACAMATSSVGSRSTSGCPAARPATRTDEITKESPAGTVLPGEGPEPRRRRRRDRRLRDAERRRHVLGRLDRVAGVTARR